MNPVSLESFANHLWQCTLFALAAGLLVWAFRKHRAPLRYALWLAASLKFLIPCSLLIAAAGTLLPHATLPPARSFLLPAIDRINTPFQRTPQALAEPLAKPGPNPLPLVLFVAWFAGVAVNLFAWWRQWRHVRGAAAGCRSLPCGCAFARDASASNVEPGVFGVWRPVLLLPEGIMSHLTPEQLDAILVHEFCHVRRRDNLTAAIHMIVEVLFWFHPVVWWIGLGLAEERERACDEEVLGEFGRPECYAAGILNVCRFYAKLPCVAGVTGSNLKKRIELIMTHQSATRLRVGGKLLLAAATLIVAAGPLFLGLLHTPRLQAQSAPTAFDSISIKHNPDPNFRGMMYQVRPGGRFHAQVPLFLLVAIAYDLPFQSPRLTGGPDEILGEQYEIDAAPPAGAIPPGVSGKSLDALMRPMLQAMLADRFKLVIHRQTKELPAYTITVARGGLKLKAASVKESDCSDVPGTGVTCHDLHGGMGRGMHGTAVDMDDVALFAANWTDRPIVNRSGLSGLYAVDTEGWAPMRPRQPRTDGSPDPEGERLADPSIPSVFTIFSRMGLNLESAKAPIDMYVIESIQRPTAN